MDAIKQRISTLANDGKFGDGTLLQVKSVSDEGKGAQYSSAICFLRVELRAKDGVIKEVPIVVKTQPTCGPAAEFMDTRQQFATEVLAYDKILPFLGVDRLGLPPNMYYGSADPGKDPLGDIVVLEDLRPKGFKITKETFLDYDTISLTLRQLGKFHGLSYRMKRLSMKTFREHIDELPPRKIVDCGFLFKGGLLRAFRPFTESNPVNEVAKKAFEKLSQNTMVEMWDKLSKPEEPFAVVAHGDFNSNNILFSFTEDGKTEGVKFFDFGTLSYLDPTSDIAFFLYMNTSAESREKHWDDLLVTYWEGVTSVESNPGFGFEEFSNNFAKKAVYGFLPCSFFLPMVLWPEEANLVPELYMEMTPEQHYDWALTKAGEKADLVLSSIVRHLLEKGYLDYI